MYSSPSVPELPEVESLRLSLLPHLTGATIRRASLLRPDICELPSPTDSLGPSHPSHPAAPSPASLLLLQLATITTLSRRGKQLALHAHNGRILIIHLGMSGQLLLFPADSPPQLTHIHATWLLEPPPTSTTSKSTSNILMVFRDPRRFGGLAPYSSLDALLSTRWCNLGPDALTISPQDLFAATSRSARPIKSLLLDQAALAGVGNIYADESLFASNIHPATKANTLTQPRIESLASAIRTILANSITQGGSSLRDYRNAQGQSGSATSLHHVYGRAGKPCHTCNTPLASTLFAQRTTVWCPTCQRAPRKGTSNSKPTSSRPR